MADGGTLYLRRPGRTPGLSCADEVRPRRPQGRLRVPVLSIRRTASVLEDAGPSYGGGGEDRGVPRDPEDQVASLLDNSVRLRRPAGRLSLTHISDAIRETYDPKNHTTPAFVVSLDIGYSNVKRVDGYADAQTPRNPFAWRKPRRSIP